MYAYGYGYPLMQNSPAYLYAAEQYLLYQNRVTADGGTVVNQQYVFDYYRWAYDNSLTGVRRSYSSNAAVKLNGISNTNLLTYSNDFSNAAWSKTDTTVTANAIANPLNGTVDADLMTEGSAGTAFTSQDYTTSLGATTSNSLFVKRGNTDWVLFAFISTGGGSIVRTWFNLSTGLKGATSVTGTGTSVVANINAISDSWYRIDFAGSMSSETIYRYRINSANADNSTTRVSGATYYLYGAQAQTGTIPTDYIPTTTTTASATQNYVQTLYDLNNDSPVDALQTTAANQPYWYYDYSIGKRVPFFDGVNDFMSVNDLAIFNAQGAGTLLAVANDLNRAGGDANHVLATISTGLGNSRLNLISRAGSSSIFRIAARRLDADSSVSATTTPSLSNYNLQGGLANWTGNELKHYSNGTQTSATAFSSGGGNVSATDSTLFRIGAFDASTDRLYGYITDIIADRTLFTSAQLASLRTLQKQYNSQLP